MSELVALVLLGVESVLLVVTIGFLLLTRKEWSLREKVLRSLEATIHVLTRQGYFGAVLEALRSSRREVRGVVTGTYPPPEDTATFAELLEHLRGASKRGVSLGYLMPKGKDKLAVGARFTRSGVEVRYHDGLIVYDMRYMVADGERVVLGLPEALGEMQPTRTGHLIHSETMAGLLLSHFSRYWAAATPYQEYLGAVVAEVRSLEPDASPRLIAAYLHLDPRDIEDLAQ